MPVVSKDSLRSSIPIIYVEGNHYEVGYQVGRTFSSMIQSYLQHHTLLKFYLEWYKKVDGKIIYDETLAAMKRNFPQYVQELEGTADGAKVEFCKLFLLQMDDIISIDSKKMSNNMGQGCSSVICKMPGKEFLGHNEDALSETLGHFYIVSAHITSDEPEGKWGTKVERFTSLCYAGNLPGFTMSYNYHGLAFSVNIIGCKTTHPGKTPRTFLTRALLAAENMKEAEQMITDCGLGLGNGLSLNMAFIKNGTVSFYNTEAGPSTRNKDESTVNTIPINQNEILYHCNRYLRLQVQEHQETLMESSIHRHKAMDALPKPKDEKDILRILGDETDNFFPVFRSGNSEMVATIATGLFNFKDMKWTIYTRNPKNSEPLIILPINIKYGTHK